jgi:hypothetical protein
MPQKCILQQHHDLSALAENEGLGMDIATHLSPMNLNAFEYISAQLNNRM